MSGRLIILPKKSYCPWNPENVERVLRDEQEHAKQQQLQQAQQQQEASDKRLKALHANKNRSSFTQPQQQHVNLFAKEEEEHWKRINSKEKTPSTKGIAPLSLGQSVANLQRAFYM